MCYLVLLRLRVSFYLLEIAVLVPRYPPMEIWRYRFREIHTNRRSHSWGFSPGVARVYGEGRMFREIPAGAKLLMSDAHVPLKKPTEKGGGGQPDIAVGERYAGKAKQRKNGRSGKVSRE